MEFHDLEKDKKDRFIKIHCEIVKMMLGGDLTVSLEQSKFAVEDVQK